MSHNLTVHADDKGRRLDRYLQVKFPSAGFAMVQKLVRKGAVRVDGKRAKADMRLEAGNTISLPMSLAQLIVDQDSAEDVVLSPMAHRWLERLQARVIADDADIIVFNKPAGLAVQGGSKTSVHVDALLGQFADSQGRPPKLVHRLDRDTSGVLLTARGGLVGQLSAQFARRDTVKTYLAWCWGQPEQHSGTVDAPLLKRSGQGSNGDQDRVVVDAQAGLSAQSNYRVLTSARLSSGLGPRISLIQWRPLTGRTHQLRVHAAYLGNSIIGDPKYGHAPLLNPQDSSQNALAKIRLQLHASDLTIAVDGQHKTFRATAPRGMRDLAKLIDVDPEEFFGQ